MDRLDYWKLCNEFSVVQAVLIICGIPPEDQQYTVERISETQCPAGYIPLRTAFVHALKTGYLQPAKMVFLCDDLGHELDHVDLHTTLISGVEINRFIRAKGIDCDFFEPLIGRDQKAGPDQPPMPVKLNAALKAWSAVSADPNRLRGKSPKQALEKWLIENAAELGLLNRHGKPNSTGIEEICKVANWKPGGGATPIASSAPMPTAPAAAFVGFRQAARTAIRPMFTADLEDEIPF